mmetsp:Transcript_32519/g.40306  ORF Transcript_32519/g.40306 Transcript_32519/m.40306 type:complete len:218 (-) Transcript_32519:98-751(-)|eukprot:CAMPEP_0170468252 /NCGR_PEP_ID=MMETSP0123-20130129/11505_2 /TAXON_ID=182087 /ORGANISM="Favella ehrenbergii, Strain Fehren 1" /LENGTH=217 /DNA_ID=CAMNT_0010734781 /DNA_START=1095 /DNA_END=1748 /DNA_ORIENTATION=-
MRDEQSDAVLLLVPATNVEVLALILFQLALQSHLPQAYLRRYIFISSAFVSPRCKSPLWLDCGSAARRQSVIILLGSHVVNAAPIAPPIVVRVGVPLSIELHGAFGHLAVFVDPNARPDNLSPIPLLVDAENSRFMLFFARFRDRVNFDLVAIGGHGVTKVKLKQVRPILIPVIEPNCDFQRSGNLSITVSDDWPLHFLWEPLYLVVWDESSLGVLR